MPIRIPKSEKRTFREIQLHYEVEKELANQLKKASLPERRRLYGVQYEELLKRVSGHPQLIAVDVSKKVERQLDSLERYLTKDSVFLEIGAGDCTLAIAVAQRVRRVYAMDVSQAIPRNDHFPHNFELIISDGVDIPLPIDHVSIAYSYQFLEHLHVDDVVDHLRNIYRVLAPGGKYLCITPNRIVGPHDISKYFEDVATGFHLKEYTSSELVTLFREAGFSRNVVHIGGRRLLRFIPVNAYEKILGKFPGWLRQELVSRLPFGALWDLAIVGTKAP